MDETVPTYKRLNTKYWQFGRPTLDILESVKTQDEQRLIRAVWDQETFMFWAINYREKKVLSVYCQTPNVDNDFAFTDRWDRTVFDFPYLTFNGLNTEPSFKEFAFLFERFLTIKTNTDFNEFARYVRRRYQPHLDTPDDWRMKYYDL